MTRTVGKPSVRGGAVMTVHKLQGSSCLHSGDIEATLAGNFEWGGHGIQYVRCELIQFLQYVLDAIEASCIEYALIDERSFSNRVQ